MNSTDRPRIPVAYKNARFLETDDARPLRILAEYLEPMHAFHREHVCDTIVFFGSARLAADGPLGRYYDEAHELARLVTLWSKHLPSHAHRYVVCTGGGGGLMEAANRGAFEAGGKTIGLNIGLPQEQRPNPYLTRGLTFEFRYFFMRKFWFLYMAKAIIVFPGGFGTIDEMMEMLTLMQTNRVTKKMAVVLYGKDFWNRAVNFDLLVEEGVINAKDLKLFSICDSVDEAFDSLTYQLPRNRKKNRPKL